MEIPFVDLKAQFAAIRDEVTPAIASVLEDTAFIGGRAVSEFETAFAAYCGLPHCVGVGNGTDALALTLRALGIGPNDEVITAANSFIATSEAITMAGAKVVFVDCDPVTYTLDIDKVAKAITSRTKALLPVHLYGRPADMEPLLDLANRHGLVVVEDAAQAHGAEISGRRVGSFGHAGCFSFYPGKNLGAYGDAGAVVTRDGDLAAKIRMLANHGRISKYDHEFEGVNSRLDGIQAAVLTIKLRHLDDWTEGRRHAAARYNTHLAALNLPVAADFPGGRHVYHLLVTRVPNRERIQTALKDVGINTGVHYPVALPNLSAYRHLGHVPADFPVASGYQDQLLSLPLYPEITEAQIDAVCTALARALGRPAQ